MAAVASSQSVAQTQSASLVVPAETIAQPSVPQPPVVPVEVAVEDTSVVEPDPITTVVTRTEAFTVPEDQDQTIKEKEFHVVVGSFRSRANADALQQQLRKENHPAVVVMNEAGMYRVFIASCDTYPEARRIADTMQSRFTGAWILVQQP